MENIPTQKKKKDYDPKLPVPYKGQPPERERLRDMLVVFVFYPITPTKHIEEVADRKPWLEFLSLATKGSAGGLRDL